MTTSPLTLWKSAAFPNDNEISPIARGYFHGLSQEEAHEVVLSVYLEESKAGRLNKATIARRLGKSPSQITRWLGAPGNLTTETYTDLLIAMGYKPKYGAEKLSELRQGNRHHPRAGTTVPAGNVSLTMGSTGTETTYKLTGIATKGADVFGVSLVTETSK